jgi:hypothetical protein
MLADALMHDAGLAVIDVETFFIEDGRGMDGKPVEIRVAGECEVVGVSGVGDSGRSG